jgi:DNA replication factor GINS
MKLDDLRSILLDERNNGKLTQIPPDLYEKGKEEEDRIMRIVLSYDNQLCDEARDIFNEVFSVRETSKDIFETRARKIISLASSHGINNINDHNELKNMTPAEKMMYESITANIELCLRSCIGCSPTAAFNTSVSHKPESEIVTQPDGDVDEPPPTEPAGTSPGVEEAESLTPDAKREGTPATLPEQKSVMEQQVQKYSLVRALTDIDTFMGIDGKEYAISKGDIITIPDRNADVLSERNVVLMISKG